MPDVTYEWSDGLETHVLRLVTVPGTGSTPYPFGAGPSRPSIDVAAFLIGSTPVTQALWQHVMGSNPAVQPGALRPIDNVSWNDVCAPGGFLDRINSGPILQACSHGAPAPLAFRLPSEAEWEYAARGGPRWTDGFRFSGSNDPDQVAWYGPRWTRAHQLGVRLFGWRIGWHYLGRFGKFPPKRTHTHDVATKAPNQLGLYDMSGNVWEWCEDTCVDVDLVPRDASSYLGEGSERRLRGGCHHNWDLHCTVWWRYGIVPDAHDGCIGFRLVLAPERSP